MKAVLLVVLCISAVFALSEQEYQDAFTKWTQKYKKVYSNTEFNTRYNIFKSNLDYVNTWNAKQSATKLGTNALADLSNEEYQKYYLGTRFDGTARLAAAKSAVASFVAPTAADSKNWTALGAVTPIKNQGQCGSCWSFSTTGSVEGIHQISGNQLVGLSEQNLMDCSTKYGNEGCNGGLMDDAFQYIIANKGIDTEASYPYTMKSERCKFNKENVGATIKSYTDVTSGSEDDLLNAANNQPISVAIDASHNSFQLYDGGVYYEPACSSSRLDHGVLVVGWGTDSDKAYWLVKNSWGTEWGLDGYIMMSRNEHNNCGIATMASFPTV